MIASSFAARLLPEVQLGEAEANRYGVGAASIADYDTRRSRKLGSNHASSIHPYYLSYFIFLEILVIVAGFATSTPNLFFFSIHKL